MRTTGARRQSDGLRETSLWQPSFRCIEHRRYAPGCDPLAPYYLAASPKDSHGSEPRQELRTTGARRQSDGLRETSLCRRVAESENGTVTRELTEALEREAATSDVLQIISRSPGDLQPVFQAMLKNAVRLCDARFGNIYRWDGDDLHLVATENAPVAFAQARGRSPLHPGPETPTGRK